MPATKRLGGKRGIGKVVPVIREPKKVDETEKVVLVVRKLERVKRTREPTPAVRDAKKEGEIRSSVSSNKFIVILV